MLKAPDKWWESLEPQSVGPQLSPFPILTSPLVPGMRDLQSKRLAWSYDPILLLPPESVSSMWLTLLDSTLTEPLLCAGSGLCAREVENKTGKGSFLMKLTFPSLPVDKCTQGREVGCVSHPALPSLLCDL